MDTVTTAVRDNIPVNSNSKSTPIPGWSDYVQPFKDDSIFWKAIWVSSGRPVDTELHRVYKNCRNKYKYAIRKVKKLESEIRKNKFLDACLNNKVGDILQELKSTRSKNLKSSSVIDGYSNSEDIAENFKNIYANICFIEHRIDLNHNKSKSNIHYTGNP